MQGLLSQSEPFPWEFDPVSTRKCSDEKFEATKWEARLDVDRRRLVIVQRSRRCSSKFYIFFLSVAPYSREISDARVVCCRSHSCNCSAGCCGHTKAAATRFLRRLEKTPTPIRRAGISTKFMRHRRCFSFCVRCGSALVHCQLDVVTGLGFLWCPSEHVPFPSAPYLCDGACR